MQIFNAMQVKAGAKVEYNKMGTLNQPIQFLPRSKKDEAWAAWNLDWLEWEGLKQIRRNARRLMKNYKLAKGIIDKTDYIIEQDNEYADMIEVLTKEDTSALELKFYPIIPSVINTLVAEFSKRSTKVIFKAVDDISYNEELEAKRTEVEQLLLKQAELKVKTNLQNMGYDIDEKQYQDVLSPDKLKTLPEIQNFFQKSYTGIVEQWATHQHLNDIERFHMEELEERAFRDMLITDREFWHFKMMEDDYNIELWNPVLTFYHKSPDTRYISEGSWAGKFDMMSVADVVDKYGWLMNEDQLKSLELIYPVRSAGYPIQGYQNDGSYYDGTKSHEWNTEMPSLGYRQYTSMWQNSTVGGDIVKWIMSESEDFFDMGLTDMLRVTTVYWKSQRRVGHLTKIDDLGNASHEVITEDYQVVDKPIYDTNLIKNKTKNNLMFGEHIDWIWINEVWGGVKIGPHAPSFWGTKSPGGINPIYLGVNQNAIKPIKFQFKGDNSLYGCKLPIEGSVFSDRNTRSTSLIDLMKPFQIGYNIVNNQIADILIDELGTVILLDQNALPKHSLGEDWGKNAYAKAYVAMKNFQILPLDTSISNTENPLAFQHYQKLDLEQTNRLMSRIQLANYFKMQAFETIGITPQRMGQQLSQETATGVEQAVNSSYAQTEIYFIQHCDYLMPRVHSMRTDLSQYYHSTKPSVRLQYITTAEEKANFEINGTDLMLRDFNVYCTTRSNQRALLDQLKQLAIQNNTTNASIYDLGNIMKSESIAEVTNVLKATEIKSEQKRKEEMQQQQQMQDQAIKAKQDEAKQKMEFESAENEKNRQADILQAQIKSAGFGSMKDINENKQSDYVDAMDKLQNTELYRQNTQIQQDKEVSRASQASTKLDLEKEKLATQKDIAMTKLQIARENKNRFDAGAEE
jgi:hypothetical protein